MLSEEGERCPRCGVGRMMETQGMDDADPVYLECSCCGHIIG